MVMTSRGKPSVFAAFSQLRVNGNFDSGDESAEERQHERKNKQKERKKSRNKKTSSDLAELKDLAFVSKSKSKKSKSKKSKPMANCDPCSPSEFCIEAPATDCNSKENDVRKFPMSSLSSIIEPQKTLGLIGVEKTLMPSSAEKKQDRAPLQQQDRQKKQQEQHNKLLTLNQIAAPPAVSRPKSSSETELGAVYTPSHITITRMDGQMQRTLSVTEVMDQLLRCTQQNTQLLLVQEKLGHTNRNLQDQLQRSSEIIIGLQNEVTMFRQICLNLQAEVSLLRSNVAGPIVPDVSNFLLPHHHRPPPGMP